MIKKLSTPITFRALLLSLIATFSHLGYAQAQKETYNVAIFLYEGAELLDFSGPGEVFGSSRGFKVYTVSADGNPILSQRFVTIHPQYAIANVPPTDILIFPGGNSAPSSNNPEVIAWIKRSAAGGSMIMSVCTGAEILAKAGLLENMNVTTYHGFIGGLQQMLPNSKVLRDTRYVDNGNVITTAGVSAGIDGALHLLSRIKGLDVAKGTATYMEYDKWKPEEGKIDYQNPYIAELLTASSQPEKNMKASLKNIPKDKMPYEGEFKNAAFALSAKGNDKEAARIMEQAVEVYPNAGSLRNELAKLYRKLGKPAPMDAATLTKLIKAESTDNVLAAVEKDRKQFPGWNLIEEEDINMEGYHLMADDITTAIKLLELNTKLFPQSWNAFDSLGEAYMMAGNKKAAIANYKKSLSMNPKNNSAKRALVNLGEMSQD